MHLSADPVEFALLCEAQGQPFALVTLVEVVGTGPRSLGAQLCVRNDGQTVGSLSGGCLDRTVIAEALGALAQAHDATAHLPSNILRFGPGSDFVDLELPCGSALQLRIDVQFDTEQWQTLRRLKLARKPYWLSWQERLHVSAQSEPGAIAYFPNLVLHAAGSSAAMMSFCKLTQAADVALIPYTQDPETRQALSSLGIEVKQGFDLILDPYSAAVTLFHEHEQELQFLRSALPQEALYIGAMGSRRAQNSRLARLREAQTSESDLAKLRGHIGLIARARTPQLLAVSVLAEIMQIYQQRCNG